MIDILEGEMKIGHGAVLVHDGWAFGPVFATTQEADLFLTWFGENYSHDVRYASHNAVWRFKRQRTKCVECNEFMIGAEQKCETCKRSLRRE